MESASSPAGPVQTRSATRFSSWNGANWAKVAILFISVFALYFVTQSPALDEVDSVNFAMGVQRYNLWNHRPHPPGYPLYVFLGWVASKLTGWGPEASLHLVSALGGAIFVTAWFLIVRLQFNQRLAWWISCCLAVVPAVWMTATKVLSDSLAAGFLSTQLLAAICYYRGGRRSALFATAVLGAAAAGVRPQLVLVVFTVLITTLKLGPRISWKWVVQSWVTLIGASLLWLIPMWYIQARIRPDVHAASIYPSLVYKFWAARTDKPTMYLFAGDWSPRYLATRCVFHFLGWFGVGFGFIQSRLALGVGALLSFCGVGSYIFRPKQAEDLPFWKFHAPWALVHIAGIFINVAAAQRYYLMIFPLLLVALVRGLLWLRSPWNWAVLGLPAVFLLTSLGIEVSNHRDDPTPVRFVHYLQQLYPPAQRKRVMLVLSTRTARHAQWYGPEFTIVHPIPPPEKLREVAKDAAAVYTDDPTAALPAKWYRVPLITFNRSVIIYWKVHYLELYLIDRQNGR